MTSSNRISETIAACRACGSADLVAFLDLGSTPLADWLPTESELDQPEHRVPLEVVFCNDCALVQITETVEPEILFCRNYPYFSSVSPALMAHFEASAKHLMATRKLGPDSLVMEAASNDGYLLTHFAQAGIPVLGIDPAEGQAKAAQERGVDTLNTFFTRDLARELAAQGKRADVFLANNVLAHVADLQGFVEGIATVLDGEGIAVIECPYLIRLIEHCEFDTIYHQHLCYFSIVALDKLFRSKGLFLNDVEQTSIHGGSLRLFVEKHDRATARVTELLDKEKAAGADRIEYFRSFSRRVQDLKEALMRTLTEVRAAGASVVGYGAPAKGCTMMSYCGIDDSHLDYLVDLSPAKQGRYMGGNHLRIESPDKLLADQPDYALILPWNFSEEIMRQQAEFIARGGKFIVPVPEVRILP